MEEFLQQISTNFQMSLPGTWVDWLLFCLWICILFFLIHRFSQTVRLTETNPLDWLFYGFLAIICSSLFRIDLFPFHVQIFPSAVQTGSEFFLILFQAIPWVAAAVFEKRMLSITLALIGSMLFSGFFVHNIFFVPLILSIALAFNFFLSRKNGALTKFQNHPLILLALAILCVFPLFYLERFMSSGLGVAYRLDLCLHDGWIYYFCRILELFLAGLVGELLVRKKESHEDQKGFSKGLSEKKKINLQFIGFLYIALVLLTVLWNITRVHALNEWKDELSDRIQVIDTSVTSVFTADAIRIDQLSKNTLLNGSNAEIREEIKSLFQPVQNLDEFYLFNTRGELVYAYPALSEEQLVTPDAEARAFQASLQENSVQAAFSKTKLADPVLSILYPVSAEDQTVQRVVLARVHLQNNPTFLPLATLIQSYRDEGVDVTFVNALFNARAQWTDDVLGESGNSRYASSQYAGIGLEGWGIEVGLERQAFLADFYHDFLPYLLATLLCTMTVSGYFFLKWMNLAKAVIALSARFSAERNEDDKAERIRSFPRIILEFLEILKHVFLKMDKRYQETQTFVDLWHSYDDRTAFQPLVKKALEAFTEDDSLFLEILIEKKQKDSALEKYLLSCEKDVEDFSYLDEQILAISREQDQLVIGNTARFHQVVRPIGKPFPQAMIITKFPIDEDRQGVLVHAFRSAHEFSKESIASFNKKAVPFYGQMASLLCLQQDLTEKKILSNLFDGLNFPLFIFMNQELFYGNKAACSFLKLDDAEGHTSIEKRVHENEIYNIMLRNNLRDRTVLTKEMPSGEKYEIELVNTVDPEAGQISVMLMKDITREKKREELTHDFVSMLSHDLRSPITVMQGYSKMLPMVGELNPTQQDYLEKIKNGLDTIMTLVEGILTEDRIEKGVVLSAGEVDLPVMIQSVVAQLESLANQKRVKISLTDVTPDVVIQGDAVLLKQAIYNVLHNAIKFSELDGSVVVKLTDTEEHVLLGVHDSGPGISALDTPFIFEKYYHPKTGDATLEKTGGSGLYIAKFIIDAHRGTITVESELGKGAVFKIQLPKRLAIKKDGR